MVRDTVKNGGAIREILETVPPGGLPIVADRDHTALSPEVVKLHTDGGHPGGTRTLMCFDVTDDERSETPKNHYAMLTESGV